MRARTTRRLRLQRAVTKAYAALDHLTTLPRGSRAPRGSRVRHSSHLADRALALHMLAHHAPLTFGALALAPDLERALANLERVAVTFPKGLAWHELMARVDALYLRCLHRRSIRSFDQAGLRRSLLQLVRRGHLHLAWVLAALSTTLGVDVEVPASSSTDQESRLAQLTHEVLIRTDYLGCSTTLSKRAARELRAGAAWACEHQKWDTLGELVFCLNAAEVRVPGRLIDALLDVQHPDGHFEEAGCRSARERAHTTAACLVALAGALDRAPR